jgi:hypothetical protein
MPQSPTSNMLLVQPSENGDAGVWDQILTALFALIDAHDHSTGKGVTVKTAGISINADLSYSSSGVYYAAKDVKALDFQPQAASGMTSYAGALFVNSSDSNNLYFRTQSGTNVRITNGTSLDITSSGGFGGDYISVAAEAAFSDAGKEYTFKQKDPDNFWAAMRSGPLRIAQLDTTESVYVEIAAPAALAGSYTITLPLIAAPAFNPVTMTTGGVLSVLTTNESITVSGTGQFKHPSRQANISSLAFRVLSGAPTVAGGNGTITGVCTLAAEIHLASTKRLLSMAWAANRGGAGTITMEVFRSASGAAGGSINTTTLSAGTGFVVTASTAINETLSSLNQYWLFVTMDNAANVFHYAGLLFDEP